MDYNIINKLLDKYFEGLTTLDEENILKNYFSKENILPEHKNLKPLFDFYLQQQNVTNPLPYRHQIKKTKKNYFLAIAAILILGLGLFSLIKLPKNNLSGIAQNNTNKKEVIQEMKIYTHHMNDGLKKVGALSLFGKETQKIFKIKKDSINKNK